MKCGYNMSGNAFKGFDKAVQPERILISEYEDLCDKVYKKFSDFDIVLPTIDKYTAVGKVDTGDIDVLILPTNRATWIDDIKKVCGESLKAFVKNGNQFMTSQSGLLKDKNCFIDFILCKNSNDLLWKIGYFNHGVCVPVVIGSFARSLSYKFAGDGLYKRVKDGKGNYHNIFITNDFKTACKVLGLPYYALPEYYDNLYSAQGVADFIVSSERFDCNTWKRPKNTDGRTITVKNRKSHNAIKKSEEVKNCYKIVDKCNKVSYNPLINDTYYERHFPSVCEEIIKVKRSGMNQTVMAISNEMIQAMKDGDTVKKTILNVLMGEINLQMSKKSISDDDIFNIAEKLIQSNNHCLEYLCDAARCNVLREENTILKRIIPNKMNKEETYKVISEIKEKILSVPKDGMAIGLTMKHIKQNGYNVSGMLVKEIVEEIRNEGVK